LLNRLRLAGRRLPAAGSVSARGRPEAAARVSVVVSRVCVVIMADYPPFAP
jgi:hypothetical protein